MFGDIVSEQTIFGLQNQILFKIEGRCG